MEEVIEKKKDLKELFRVLKFFVISTSAGIIQIGSFALFNEVFVWNYWVSYLLSLLLSIVWNFTINRKLTFKSANNIKIAMLLVLAFYAVFTPVSTVLGELAENNGVNEYIVLGVTMLSNLVLEFLFTRYVVYRNSCDTAKTKKEKLAEQEAAAVAAEAPVVEEEQPAEVVEESAQNTETADEIATEEVAEESAENIEVEENEEEQTTQTSEEKKEN